jgi:DNA-binding NarL/FixJ family response regulator
VTKQSTRRAFVIEDHELFRDGLRQFLNDSPGHDWIGESDDLPHATDAVKAAKPDLLLLDLNIKGNNALHFLQTLRKGRGPQPLVCVLSNYEDIELVERAKEAGADAYVLKEEGQERLADVLTQISPNRFIGPAQQKDTNAFEGFESFDRIAKLSPRETECIPYLASKLTTEAAAGELGISVFTLRNHRKHIYRKLNIQTKTELFAICKQQRWDIFELPEE